MPSEAAKKASIPVVSQQWHSERQQHLRTAWPRLSFQPSPLTQYEETLVFRQTLLPILQVVSQIQFLCRPEARLRRLVRLPYLRCIRKAGPSPGHAKRRTSRYRIGKSTKRALDSLNRSSSSSSGNLGFSFDIFPLTASSLTDDRLELPTLAWSIISSEDPWEA